MTNEQISKGNEQILTMLGKKFEDPLNAMYDKDWNMLIDAHNKARELFMNLDRDIVKIMLKSDECIVVRFGYVNFFSTFENQYTISSSWNKMVDFAIWYNSISK